MGLEEQLHQHGLNYLASFTAEDKTPDNIRVPIFKR